jgi:hypothetical protein
LVGDLDDDTVGGESGTVVDGMMVVGASVTTAAGTGTGGVVVVLLELGEGVGAFVIVVVSLKVGANDTGAMVVVTGTEVVGIMGDGVGAATTIGAGVTGTGVVGGAMTQPDCVQSPNTTKVTVTSDPPFSFKQV